MSNKLISDNSSINIDIFRALLAQWVILGHMGPALFNFPIVPGRVAVWGFFIISGYLNAKSFSRRINSSSLFDSLTGYYLSRIKRIYPLLIINGLVVTFMLGTPLHGEWHVLFPFINSSSYELSNGVLWTLVIEIQLYLMTPILFFVVSKAKILPYVVHILFCMGLIILIPLLKVYFTGNHDLVDDRTVLGNIGFYLLGMIFFEYRIELKDLYKNINMLLWIVMIGLLVYFVYSYNILFQGIQFILGPLVAILLSFLVLNAIAPLVNKSHCVFKFLGYYTYELYVLHGLLVFVFHKLDMHGVLSILLMWWLSPIILVITYDLISKKIFQPILK